MENRTINLFYITIEEEKCEPPGFAKREPLLKKWIKRRQDRKQGKTGLPVYEVLRQFPYPGGGIRLCYCILPRTFLKEAENAKKMAKWFFCMDEAIKNAEENLGKLLFLGVGDTTPDLIVYPETTYPFVVVDGDEMPLGTALGTNVVVGATTFNPSIGLQNSMVLCAGNMYF